ncbi:MAG: hypothetical protein QF464_18155 [Myxococcota bacterium]|nr:hypothetical protein [Myxococcota bacterium]
MTIDAEVASRGALVAASLTRALGHRMNDRVTLVPTNNRVRLVSYRRRRGQLEVRVSRRLMALGDEVVEPIVGFVCDAPGGRERLRRLYQLLPDAPARPQSRPTLSPRGEIYDLAAIAREESMRAFGEPTDVDITWGPRRRLRRAQRSIRLGTYHFEHAFIRIHRRLDDPAVPEWFVGFVVFHELLHHRIGAVKRRGRRVLHPPAFRLAEATHPRYREAMIWEERELPKLLRARRAGGGRR